jgi:DNA-binding beta-propeller fold protein YncE/predicted small secreted protein
MAPRVTITTLGVATLLAGSLVLAGCGNTYRPVVSAISPVGPASQPTKYAVAVSSPSPTANGLATFVDFSGDTVLSTPSILSNPSYFAASNAGNQGFAINASGSLNEFNLNNPAALLTSDVNQTTLNASTHPITLSAITPSGSQQTLFIPEATGSQIAVLSANGAPALLQNLAVAANPVYVVGADQTPRVYAISQGTGGNGVVSAIESINATSLSVSASIPVGVKPVYGVMTSDTRRAFILNQGSGTVSVINVPSNALDTTTPVIPAVGTLGLNPVWADLSPVTSELVVLNQGDGVHAGSLSIINIPLCSSNTQVTNPNCNAANPVDATGFGQVLATVNVGISPQMVSVLRDGSRAYVVNLLDSTGTCNAGEGSVTVVNLVTGVASSTICGISTVAGTAGVNATPGAVYGHPNTVAATTGTPTGKVYVTSADSEYMTIIYTDTDTVQTHIPLQGLGVRVVVTSP